MPDGIPKTLGAAFHHDAAGANAFQKLFRRQQAAQRDWNRARAELREMQAQRAEAEQELTAAVDPPSPNLPRREPSAGPSVSVPSTPPNGQSALFRTARLEIMSKPL